MITPSGTAGDDLGFGVESLRMLETTEGQKNAIFACFGSAAQSSQRFEEGLVGFLIVYNLATKQHLSIDDLESRNVKLSKQTMGGLLSELRKIVMFSDDAYTRYFEDALSKRNFLMHRFFLERNDRFETQESRLELFGELTSIQGVIDRATVAINAMRIAMSRTLGIGG